MLVRKRDWMEGPILEKKQDEHNNGKYSKRADGHADAKGRQVYLW